jgi:hypothetical protein
MLHFSSLLKGAYQVSGLPCKCNHCLTFTEPCLALLLVLNDAIARFYTLAYPYLQTRSSILARMPTKRMFLLWGAKDFSYVM